MIGASIIDHVRNGCDMRKTTFGLIAAAWLAGAGPGVRDALAASNDTSGSAQVSPAGPSSASPSSADNAASGPSRPSNFDVATGFDYFVGHYGASADTTVWSLPLDIKAQLGRLRLQATLPYDVVKGPGQLVDGVFVSAPGSTETTTRSGIGDLNLGAAYLVLRQSGAMPALELGGSVKLPTAPATIGTRRTDYAASANLYKTLAPRLMLFGSVGYSWLGSPALYRLEDGVTASAGLNYRSAGHGNYGIVYGYRTPVVAGLPGQALISPYMTYRLNRLFGVTLYGMAGLTSISPRIGAGLRVSVFP